MAKDMSGWMPGVEQIRTSEWGYSDVAEDSMYPQAVVHHVMQGYQRTMLDWARNNNGGKSAHFTVGREGRIVQHVSIWDPAWHAGDVNAPTWRKYTGGNPNKYTVGIEQEGFSIVPGYGYDYLYDATRPWPEAMVQAVISINRFVFASCANWLSPNEDSVITHSMLNTASRKQDPGDLWRATVLPRLLQALQPVQAPPPPPPVDTVANERNRILDAFKQLEQGLR